MSKESYKTSKEFYVSELKNLKIIHLYSVKDFELLISISTEKLKPKCLVFKLKSISDSSFAFDE